ncbi:MAG: hypothetical protein Kow0037_20080 [Calditrichia bacterium]
MKHFTKIILVSLTFWAFAFPAQGQDAPRTLKDLWAILDQQNLSLQQLEAQIKGLENFQKSEKADYFPTIRLQGNAAHVSEVASLELPFILPGQPPVQIEAGVKNQYDIALTAVQPIFTGFRTRNRVKLAKAQLQARQEALESLRNQLKLQVAQVYYNLRLLQLQKAIYHSSQKRWELAKRIVDQKFKLKQATAFDTLNVARQLIRIQSHLAEADNQYQKLKNGLAALLNLEDVDNFEFKEEPLNQPVIRPLSFYLQEALARRAELNSEKHQIAAARFQKQIVRSGYLPQINASISYHYARPGINFFKDEWMDYYQAGVSFSWELWHRGKRQAQVRQVNWQLKQARLKLNETEAKIRREVKDAYQELLHSRQQLEISRNLLQREEQRYRLAAALFEKGQIGILDLSATENELTGAQLNYNIRQAQFSLAWHNLQFASGNFR